MKVFSRCLKTGSDGAEVMSAGNSFHKSAPKTGNDRLTVISIGSPQPQKTTHLNSKLFIIRVLFKDIY